MATDYQIRDAAIFFNRIESEYGLSAQAYVGLLKIQGGVCALCGNPETRRANSGGIKKLAIDHDHRTGVVRGLLCMKCNTALGSLIGDDDSRLVKLIEYLRDDHPKKIERAARMFAIDMVGDE